ncbi:hypothetical protein ALC56_06902 [Trachymyrmex septentrionalis]|uniref:Uncharacterized protein n=1 Tax=Trachymyrmex septentrionalis TaxID=34720 RepID=A0A195FET8_9HYME|nr:hypothetical protein ALC56_06902 [Trachymyrmex septentrionalis]
MGKLRSGLSSNIIIDTAVAAERIRNFNEKELGVSGRRTDKMGRGFALEPAQGACRHCGCCRSERLT